MPYLNLYQISVTYEIDAILYETERSDFTMFEWISNIGGLSFMSSLAAYVVSVADSPDMFVTAAMLDEGDVHLTKRQTKITLNSSNQI